MAGRGHQEQNCGSGRMERRPVGQGIHSSPHSLHKYLVDSCSAPLSCLGQEQKTDVVSVTQESWFYPISWGSLADLGLEQGLDFK